VSARELPSAEVLIPHHDRAESLRQTLDALRRQTHPTPVRVVDNNSSDGTREMLEGEFPDVACTPLDSNLGFGAALNRGVEECDAAVLIFLNNDAVPDERFCEELLAAQAASGAEMIAACLGRPDGLIESLGIEVDRSLIAYDVAFGEEREGAVKRHPDPPLSPSGGAAAFAREALVAAGGFDEGFFAYLEDVDLGIRMRMLGMRCVIAPGAIAWHEHSGTLRPRSEAKNRLLGSGRGRLARKYAANLTPTARARGIVIDAAVYAGKALIDRNLGAVRGRLEAAHLTPRGPVDPRFGRVPLVDRGIVAALRLRLGRRTPYAPTAASSAAR
jgi:GT2 family glycosyltransferase